MGMKCPNCEEIVDLGDLVPCYECSSCGSEYSRDNSADGDSNRCPDCNKFGAKTDQKACPECGDTADEAEYEAAEEATDDDE